MTMPPRPPSRTDILTPEEYERYIAYVRRTQPFAFTGLGIPDNEPGIKESRQYKRYLESEPQIANISERTRELIGTPEFAEVEARRATSQAEAAFGEGAPEEEAGFQFGGVPEIETIGGYEYEVREINGEKVYTRIGPARGEEDERGMTEAQRETLEFEKTKWGKPSEQDVWEREYLERQSAKERQFEAISSGREDVRQREMIDWYREQATMEQQEGERRYMAQLAAQPRSWLQSAAYTGQTPVMQPWMQPLMPQEYGYELGKDIPGWTQASAAGIPELTRPSAQLWSRMTPSAQEQYGGYKQARTGATPSDIDWRRQSTSAPGGGRTQLSWLR